MIIFYPGNLGDHHLPEVYLGLPVMLSFAEIKLPYGPVKRRTETRTKRRFFWFVKRKGRAK